jgi:hypothetical protein
MSGMALLSGLVLTGAVWARQVTIDLSADEEKALAVIARERHLTEEEVLTQEIALVKERLRGNARSLQQHRLQRLTLEEQETALKALQQR